VLDNTSKRLYKFTKDQFHGHFQLLDKHDLEPKLWKRIQQKQECESKKGL
jgi:hypothetical protein